VLDTLQFASLAGDGVGSTLQLAAVVGRKVMSVRQCMDGFEEERNSISVGRYHRGVVVVLAVLPVVLLSSSGTSSTTCGTTATTRTPLLVH